MKKRIMDYRLDVQGEGANGLVSFKLEGDPIVHHTAWMSPERFCAVAAVLASKNAYYDPQRKSFVSVTHSDLRTAHTVNWDEGLPL